MIKESVYKELLLNSLSQLNSGKKQEDIVEEILFLHEKITKKEAFDIVKAAQELLDSPLTKKIKAKKERSLAIVFFLIAGGAFLWVHFLAPALFGKNHEQGIYYFIAAGGLIVAIISLIKSLILTSITFQ